MLNSSEIEAFGYSNLGPIFHRFLLKVRTAQHAVESEDPVILFMARGGLRLHHFYQVLYPAQSKQMQSGLMRDLYVSRFAVFKAALALKSEFAVKQIESLFANKSCSDTIMLLTTPELFRSWHGELTESQAIQYASTSPSKEFFGRIFAQEHPNDHKLVAYFETQLRLLKQHFEAVVGSRKKVLLVDTGWSGSIAAGLQEIFSEHDIVSIFFGKFSYFGKVRGAWLNDLVGLEIEGEGYLPWKPTTALLLNRHLIEGVCEVNFPSVSTYHQSEDGKLILSPDYEDLSLRVPKSDEALAVGVQRYLQDHQDIDVAHVVANAVKAHSRLHRFSLFPTRKSVDIGRFSRSIDMGQSGETNIVLDAKQGSSFFQKIARMRKSLWVPGQIAVEFNWLRIPLQLSYAAFCFIKTIRLRMR